MTEFEIIVIALLSGIFLIDFIGYLETSGKMYRLKKRLSRKIKREK